MLQSRIPIFFLQKKILIQTCTFQLGQPIRLLLVYNGIDFDEKRYDLPEEWAEKKFTLGLDFPNLPYYIEGSTKLTQSAAILKFLARKHGMRPKTEEERTRCNLQCFLLPGSCIIS